MKIASAILAATAVFPSITWALQGAFLWPIPQFIDSGDTDVILNVNQIQHIPSTTCIKCFIGHFI